MDGYAVCFGPGDRRTTFRLVRHLPRGLRPGDAFPVATGAALPPGATAVARLESSRRDGNRLHLTAPVRFGRDIHRAGAAIARGTEIAGPDRSIDGYSWAALLAAGVPRLSVRDLRITVLATGNELARPRPRLRPPVDAIGPWIASVAAPWAVVRRAPPLPDDDRALRGAVETACRESDLVITIGGTSIGPRDRTKPAIAAAGRVLVGGTRVNVLKRAGVGWVRGRPVLMLPGQVEGAVVAFHEFGLRLIERMRGTPIRVVESRRLARGFAVDHRMDSTVLFERAGDRVLPLGWGVTRYPALLRATGYGYFARGRTYRRGQVVRIQRFIRSGPAAERPRPVRRPPRARAARRRRRP
jgi:molybdopterin molybdotransferase